MKKCAIRFMFISWIIILILFSLPKVLIADSSSPDQDYFNWPEKLNQPSTKAWTIIFNAEVDLNCISEYIFIALDKSGEKIVSGISITEGRDNNSIVISAPEDGYISGEYFLFIKKGIRGLEYPDKSLKKSIRMRFTISNEYIAPKVIGVAEKEGLKLAWEEIKHEELKGYNIVISKNNPSPKYPDDGYLYWITDKTVTSVTIDNTAPYNGGDFGGYLKPGEKYYFTVTARYNDGTDITGNVVELTYPQKIYIAPKVSGDSDGITVKLCWETIIHDDIKGYCVVISKNNPSPKYPEDGYLAYFTDLKKTYTLINNSIPYNGGDFGGYLVSGVKYYFSITAIYDDGTRIPGNAIEIIYPLKK